MANVPPSAQFNTSGPGTGSVAPGPELTPDRMDERQLRNALGGAMAWQQIVQARHGGPDELRDAAGQTEAVCRELRRRGVALDEERR